MITALFLTAIIIAAVYVFFRSRGGTSFLDFTWRAMKCFLYLLGLLVLIGCFASFFGYGETNHEPVCEDGNSAVSVDLNRTP